MFRTKKVRLALVLTFFCSFGAFAYRYSTFRITKNFHAVDPGKFYRSAQLTPDELEEIIIKYGIKTVVSLRGDPQHVAWLAPELAVLKKYGVAFKALWWTAEQEPADDQVVPFLDIINSKDYPILVHCRVGSDRTGLASAIYAFEKMGLTKEDAIRQNLNFDFWHVPYFKPNMVGFMKKYEGETWARNRLENK